MFGSGGRKMLSGNRFVIHKHCAKNIHYDFRLEINSVLKSWAIPKQVPLKYGQKRLAVEVEDHPLSFLHFEGEIPEGEYGAGKIIIWDSGEYELIERKESKIVFKLKGKKIKGKYCLIKFKKDSFNKNLWLLFRVKK